MKWHNFRKLAVKMAKRLAWVVSAFIKPVTIFRWTGILAYRAISYKEFSPVPFHPEAQSLIDDQKPPSIRNGKIWAITPQSDLVLSHVLTINEGVADRLGNVFDPVTGELVYGATHKHRHRVKRAHIPRPYRLGSHVERFTGEVAVFTASNQNIYWHWLLDVIPRLIMLEEVGKQPQSLYIQLKTPFQREMLTFMEILSKNTVIDCDKFPMISASRLLVPCHQIMEGRQFPSWVWETLQKKFLPFARKGKVGAMGRVYISRAGAGMRRISSEEKLLPVLRDYGFQVVKLEELTFSEQVGIFKEAEVIVAPNGSGLANLVFCSKGITIIELFPNVPDVLNSLNYTYNHDYNYRLARSLDLIYYFACGSSGNSHFTKSSDYLFMPEDLIGIFDLAKIPMSK